MSPCVRGWRQREREHDCFAELMGGPANLEVLAAFDEGREPDFTIL